MFSSLTKSLSHLCFSSHDPQLNEIRFCYVSEDALVGFGGSTTGCNRAAVYNYRRQTWSFYDLPNVTFGANASIVTGQTYEESNPVTYDQMGGTYLGEADEAEKHTIYSSITDLPNGLTGPRIYGFTPASGGRLNKPIETEALKDAFIERIGIDLDENGVASTAYKSLLAFYPQLSLSEPSDIARFQFGATDVIGASPAWDQPQPFDPSVTNKTDPRVAGRYLGYRLYYRGVSDFSFSGFDVRLTVRGKR